MTLCDAGPLVAMIDGDDSHHDRCSIALQQIPAGIFITTWPCLTEAMHLLGRAGGIAAQDQLWSLIADGHLTLSLPTENEWQRTRELMKKYADAPMDLADASLVVAAESLGLKRILTLDRHFHAYRIKDSDPFEIVP